MSSQEPNSHGSVGSKDNRNGEADSQWVVPLHLTTDTDKDLWLACVGVVRSEPGNHPHDTP